MPGNVVQQNTKWVDGVRGLAALLVVNSHITFSLAPYLLWPALDEHGTTVALQMPILRNLIIGRPSVAVFCILVGFTNALKPIQKIHSGQIDVALTGIAKSVVRRVCRFVLPASIVTIISWVLCQFGGFAFSRSVDSWWLRDISPAPSASAASAGRDLLLALFKTWTTGDNKYDKIQWTLCFLLAGSMLVYLALLSTAYIHLSYRIMIFAILYSFYYTKGDGLIGTNVFFGLIMAELYYSPHVEQYVQRRPLIFTILSSTVIFLGLIANGFPEEHSNWAPWSTAMVKLARYIFPGGVEVARFYPSVGAQMVCLGVMYNAPAKRLLSHPWLRWLGKYSFAVYLIHPTLLRTVLAWMVFGLGSLSWASSVSGEEGDSKPHTWVPLPKLPWLILVLPLFYLILYPLAMLWEAYVDRLCSGITRLIERALFKGEEREKPLVEV